MFDNTDIMSLRLLPLVTQPITESYYSTAATTIVIVTLLNSTIILFTYCADVVQPGQVLNQTRRSIDFAEDVGSSKSPGFIIIGAQKCGTTSLYEYICQHPLVLRGKRRETHYFDWRWNEKLPAEDAEAHLNYCKQFPSDSSF